MSAAPQEFGAVLPIGYADEDGRVHNEAVLRKMRGHEEALLYDDSLSAPGLVTELIRGCLLRLGDIEQPDAAVISALYTADRNYLLLEIRRITLGDLMSAVYRCPACGSGVMVTEDLGALPVRHLDGGQPEDRVVELEDGYTDHHGEHHTSVELALPRGDDEEFVAPMLDRDPLKAHDALLLRCVRRFGSLPRSALEAYGVKILRDLALGDRRRLQRAIDGEAAGVDFARAVSCGECGSAFEQMLDVSRFLVPSSEDRAGCDRRSSTSPSISTGPGARS